MKPLHQTTDCPKITWPRVLFSRHNLATGAASLWHLDGVKIQISLACHIPRLFAVVFGPGTLGIHPRTLLPTELPGHSANASHEALVNKRRIQ